MLTDDQRRLFLTLGVTLLGVIVIHHSTFYSMVEKWWTSETYLHCFLVGPISGYLIWKRWPQLREIDFRPFHPAILAVVVVSASWWVSDFLGIQVGKQLSVVALLPLAVLTLAGTSATKAIAFPLCYLVFAVPFGVAAIPYLIDFTAFFTVKALQITGIPVLRDGAFFSIPAGNFEVARACSGIRYLLASLAIGTLYGYLIFASLGKRIAFFLFALVLPIVANGFRAYGIVLLAHYSDMKIAVGADHLVYGGIFFGLVMLIMFWVGSRFQDRPIGGGETERVVRGPHDDDRAAGDGFAIAAAIVLFVAACAPVLALAVSRMEVPTDAAAIPKAADGWRASASMESDWHPRYVGASQAQRGVYVNDGDRVDLAVFRYDSQRQGSELSNIRNSVADGERWRVDPTGLRQLDIDAGTGFRINESILRDGSERRLVWWWHEVNGEPVDGNLEIKLHELRSVLGLSVPVSAAVLTSIRVDEDLEPARGALRSFVESLRHPIRACLYASPESGVECVAPRDTGTGAWPEDVSDGGER